jgi:hypothetical protein
MDALAQRIARCPALDNLIELHLDPTLFTPAGKKRLRQRFGEALVFVGQ